jgi:hypothetical protein
MHIGELHHRDQDRLVINTEGNCVVISRSGAVFNNFMTDDLAQLHVASANLFKADWEVATEEQLDKWLSEPNTPMLYLWSPTPLKG